MIIKLLNIFLTFTKYKNNKRETIFKARFEYFS